MSGRGIANSVIAIRGNRLYFRQIQGMDDQEWIKRCESYITAHSRTDPRVATIMVHFDHEPMLTTDFDGFNVFMDWQHIDLDERRTVHFGGPNGER